MTANRGLAAARRAAAEIVTRDGGHLGAGLLLTVPGVGPVVLTCHHVVARVPPETLRVILNDGKRRFAWMDKDASRIGCDAAVLRFDDPPAVDNPLLHVPDADGYEGPLDGRALSPGGGTGNFRVTLQAADCFTTEVPYEPKRYTLPDAFLLGVDDANDGISGSPVYCELGIVGLVHFARDASPREARSAYLNPLTAWLPGLPGLERFIEPFASSALRGRADLFRAGAAPACQLPIRGLRSQIYVSRPEDEQARRALDSGRSLCLIGRRNSGKSRFVWQLLHDNPDSIVVLPQRDEPPPDLGMASEFRNRDVLLVFENLHIAASEWKPLLWYERFRRIARQTTLVLTSGNGDGWKEVEGKQSGMLEVVGPEQVFLSKDEGQDLSREAGWELAQRVGMDFVTFDQRFDGTPGSLVVDEDLGPAPAQALPRGAENATAILPVSANDVPDEIPNNLPRLTSSFVGREREARVTSEALEGSPLVTLTGARGTGKTRLALHVATTHAERFPDGVWYVDLGPARDGYQVISIAVTSVRAPRRALVDTEDALVEHLRGQRSLVVLNGPDHVHGVTAALAARLTDGQPELRVLVATRKPLGVPRERVVGLEPLTDDDGAKRLFLDRIAPEEPAAALGPEGRSHAKSLYAELEGNPAALEVTAAQVRETGLREVIEARDRHAGPNGRVGGDGGVLRLAVTRSLSEGSSAEAAVFARLAAFPDWFTLGAARTVAAGDGVEEGDVPDLLCVLADRALVIIDKRDDEAQRFRVLPSLREVAEEQLAAMGGGSKARRRHALYYLALATTATARLEGRAGRSWVARLERDHVHLRAALRWSIANDMSAALRLGAALWSPFVARSRFSEGRRWLKELLDVALPRLDELSPDEVAPLGEVVIGAAYLAYHQADYDAAKRHQRQLRAVGRRPGAATSRGDEVNILGLVARRRCRYARAKELLTQAVSISRRHDDLPRLADRVNTLGNIVREKGGNLEEARALQHQSFSLYARLGSKRGCAMALCDLAYVLMDLGELTEARTHFARSLAARRQVGDRQGQGQSLNGLGQLDRRHGELDAAMERHSQALELFDSMGDRLRTAESFEALGLVHMLAGRPEKGSECLARAEVVRAGVGAPRPLALAAEVEAVREGRGVVAASLHYLPAGAESQLARAV